MTPKHQEDIDKAYAWLLDQERASRLKLTDSGVKKPSTLNTVVVLSFGAHRSRSSEPLPTIEQGTYKLVQLSDLAALGSLMSAEGWLPNEFLSLLLPSQSAVLGKDDHGFRRFDGNSEWTIAELEKRLLVGRKLIRSNGEPVSDFRKIFDNNSELKVLNRNHAPRQGKAGRYPVNDVVNWFISKGYRLSDSTESQTPFNSVKLASLGK